MQRATIRNPAAYLTDLLKRIAVDGSAALTSDLDEALDNLVDAIASGLSITDSTDDPTNHWLDRLKTLRAFVRRHASGEIKHTTLRLIDGRGGFDRPDLAAARAVEQLLADPALVKAGSKRFSKEIRSLLDVA